MINHRYTILSEIGEGRSRVFLTYDNTNQSNVAIKILSCKSELSEKKEFRKEYFFLKKFNHPNIIKAFNYGTIFTLDSPDVNVYNLQVNDLYLTLEYFDGDILNEFLDQLNDEQINAIIYIISIVYFYLHQSNFLYNDLKPENILIKNRENQFEIKIVDFDLASHLLLNKEKNIRGSVQYIAPEVLNREARNHKADLYSLGVLLYRIVFKKLPFDSKNPVEIYKAQITGSQDFPEVDSKPILIDTIKNLLQKNAYDRFETSLHVLDKLGISLSENFKSNWSSPKIFTGRQNIISLLNEYIKEPTNHKPIKILGDHNSGKSFLLNEIYFKYEESIFIDSDSFYKNSPIENQLLKIIFLNNNVFPNLSNELKNEIFDFLNATNETSINDYRSIISRISKTANFVLLVDDINDFDPITIEILSQIIPILIVNGIKVIFSERSNSAGQKDLSPNAQVFELKPFSVDETNEFIEKNFAYFFPKETIKEFIHYYSDYQPGNICDFIKELVNNNIIVFNTEKGVFIERKDSDEKIIRKTREDIYNSFYETLGDTEKSIVQLFAAVNLSLSNELIADFLELPKNKTNAALQLLLNNNMLKQNFPNNTYEVSSQVLEEFFKLKILNAEALHNKIANWMSSKNGDFNKDEIARQFELARKYDECYQYYYEEIKTASASTAYRYEIDLLNHLLTLPFDRQKIINIKIDLSKAYLALGDANTCYSLTLEILSSQLEDSQKLEVLIQKGKCQISLGEFQKGIDTLEITLQKIFDPQKKNEILAAVADAYIFLNSFEKSVLFCDEIISSPDSTPEVIGKAYNLLGLVELYKKNNTIAAIEKFNLAINTFNSGGLLNRVAGMKINIGSVYVMMNDYENAQKIWNEALNLNELMGNLEQEGKLLLNYGILYYDMCEYEKASKQYLRAKLIFENLGDKNSTGLTLTNIGEVNFVMCNYSEAIDSLLFAKGIFEEINNHTELAEVLFLFGKLSFTIGDYNNLKKVKEKLSQLLDDNLLPNPYDRKLVVLNILLDILEKRFDVAKELLSKSILEFAQSDEREDNYNFAFLSFRLIEILIKLELFEEAEKIVTQEKLKQISDKNSLIAVERDYLKAKLYFQSNIADPFENISSALTKLEKLSITNLSWKVTFLAGCYYERRGNFSKTNNFFHLTKAILLRVQEFCKSENLIQLLNSYEETAEIKKYIEIYTMKKAKNA